MVPNLQHLLYVHKRMFLYVKIHVPVVFTALYTKKKSLFFFIFYDLFDLNRAPYFVAVIPYSLYGLKHAREIEFHFSLFSNTYLSYFLSNFAVTSMKASYQAFPATVKVVGPLPNSLSTDFVGIRVYSS